MPGKSGLGARARWCGIAVTLALAGCAASVTGEPVAGDPPAAFYPIDSDSVSLRVEFEATAEEVNEYWTSERQRDAIPITPGVPSDIGVVGGDRATGVVIDPTDGVPSADRRRVAPTDAGDLADAIASPAHGRLYMVFGDLNYVCSATVVNSEGRDVVVTAAHCVWDTDTGAMATYLAFIPADQNHGESRPYGTWAAEYAYVPSQFTEGAFVDPYLGIVGDGWAYDFAFLEMAPDEDGQLIQDVTGGQGIAFGVPVEDLVVIGYPSGEPFDGATQRYCATDQWEPDGYAYVLDCLMTPGSSGGAWLAGFDPDLRAGYVVAATSYGNDWLSGAAPLGAVALDLYTQAGAQ